MSGDLFVMGGFVPAGDRNLIDGIIGQGKRFFRIGPMREEISKQIGREIPRPAIVAAAKRLGYKVNGLNFATREEAGDGLPTNN